MKISKYLLMSESAYNHMTMDYKIKKVIDFDKEEEMFYTNFYLEDCKYVVKIPLFKVKEKYFNVKIEKFNLSKHILFS